ncbi:hypothetical protein ACTJKO_07590 [Curtobacterium sp. 22159]|uniref:hypothetical protein n=1 Tax=Curtobacterium sp. 22159 TaxID=3453882 RepID=UPI003F86CB5B
MAADSYGNKNEPQFAGAGVPQDAADLTTVAAYAALVGNRKVGTVDQRNAVIGTKDAWEGLTWYDLTDGFTYTYKSGGWVLTFDDTGWITPPALAGTAGSAQYRRRNGLVFFQGTWTPTADSQGMFRLNAGFRPANTGTWWCERGTTTGPAAKIEVQASTGLVIFRQSGGSGAINFSGLGPFIAEQ